MSSSYKLNSLEKLELPSRSASIVHKSAVEHEQAVTFSHTDDAHLEKKLESLKSRSLDDEDMLMHDGTAISSVSKTSL